MAEPETYLRAAAGLARVGQLAAAEAAYLAATDHWPEQDLAWMGLGNARCQMGDYGRAERAYRHSLTLLPEDPAAIHNLAWALIRQERPAAALPFARQAAAHEDAQYQSALQRLQAE